MEVKRVTPEVPDTIDITGLTLREAGALRRLLMYGIEWHHQPEDIQVFLADTVRALDAEDVPTVRLDFDDLHGLND